LDTRTKIVESLPEDCDIVEGCFDPLLATHAEQIAAIGESKPIAVIIRDPESPLLEARARAELAAGMRDVDYVLIGGPLKGRVLTEDRDELMRVIRAKHGK